MAVVSVDLAFRLVEAGRVEGRGHRVGIGCGGYVAWWMRQRPGVALGDAGGGRAVVLVGHSGHSSSRSQGLSLSQLVSQL